MHRRSVKDQVTTKCCETTLAACRAGRSRAGRAPDPRHLMATARFRIIAAVLVAALILTFMSASTIASHRSRASRSARTDRSSRARSKRGESARSRRGESRRGRRGEHLSRAERRRARRGGYLSARRGRGRRSTVYYEARESSAASPRPASTGIPTERVTEIQRALIKGGYLEGQATGQYDDSTIAAMKQFQTDNGFPASGLPSAHTLKKLGVSKRSNDGYAVPINSATEDQKKPSQPAPQVKKGKSSTGDSNQ